MKHFAHEGHSSLVKVSEKHKHSPSRKVIQIPQALPVRTYVDPSMFTICVRAAFSWNVAVRVRSSATTRKQNSENLTSNIVSIVQFSFLAPKLVMPNRP